MMSFMTSWAMLRVISFAGEAREGVQRDEHPFELADVAVAPVAMKSADVVGAARPRAVSAFFLRMATLVSKSGGWMSAIRPHSKRERSRSSSVGDLLGRRVARRGRSASAPRRGR